MRIINNIFDIHTHILPGIDDGSKNADMSLKMLMEEKKQGVGKVILTPHFYSDCDSPKTFLNRREKALSCLKDEMRLCSVSSDDIPEVVLGAEVLFFNGMSVAEELKELCINGTDMMLLEMPFTEWTDSVFREIDNLSQRLSVIPVIAHLDRYLSMQNKKAIEELIRKEVIISVNAESFSIKKYLRFILKLMGEGVIYMLGSDCHNLDKRNPNIEKAIPIIREKLGDEFTESFFERENDLLMNSVKEKII